MIPFFLAVITCLLAFGSWQLQRWMVRCEERLDLLERQKKDSSACQNDRSNCTRCPTWPVFKRHTHEGLDKDSRVIPGDD